MTIASALDFRVVRFLTLFILSLGNLQFGTLHFCYVEVKEKGISPVLFAFMLKAKKGTIYPTIKSGQRTH